MLLGSASLKISISLLKTISKILYSQIKTKGSILSGKLLSVQKRSHIYKFYFRPLPR